MLQQEQPEDFVIATDVQHGVRDFVNAAAKVAEMMRENLKSAERDELVKYHDFKTVEHHE